MTEILVEKINPGSIIARDVYNSDGAMLLSRGTVFERDFVERLRDMGVDRVCIEEDEEEKKQIIESLKKNSSLSDIIFEKTKIQAESQMKKIICTISKMNCVNIQKIKYIVTEIVEQLLSKKSILLSLSSLRSVDDYTYQHSVNVCVLSIIVGIDLNMDMKSLKNLGIGAMLHDIGKVYISESILNKPSTLTSNEYEQIKKHTDYGYEILSNTDISEEAASIALFHHEKYDGTGYNKKISGNNIPLFSRIVAVTDVYDAMSNDRVYKKRLSPDKVYKEIIYQGNRHFDANIMKQFMNHITLYPIGTGVILNTNHKGVVIAQNEMLPESPVIRVFKKDNRKIDYTDIDLARTRYLYIKETF